MKTTTSPVDTSPHPITDYARQYARALSGRATHPLNDQLVSLRDGAETTPMYADGAALRGGSGRRGYVWLVDGERALIDFGQTESGIVLRVFARMCDLERVHPLSEAQMLDLRQLVRTAAKEWDESLETAFNSMVMPDYVWDALVAAADAAGPEPGVDPTDLFADTPERNAAADAALAAIKASALAEPWAG